MLLVLNRVNMRGHLPVGEDDVAALVQCHAERKLAEIRLILQRHILPHGGEGGP